MSLVALPLTTEEGLQAPRAKGAPSLPRILVLALLVAWSLAAGAGATEPVAPFLSVFRPADYHAHAQTWAATQDPRGVMYFGNGDGVLEFDGVRWSLVRVANESIVRSLAVDADGTVWVGAVGELGFVRRDEFGKLGYVSLLDRVAEGERDFTDVWRIFATDHGVFFWARGRLLRWRDGHFSGWPLDSARMPAVVAGRLYTNRPGSGLEVLDGDRFRPLRAGALTSDLDLVTILPWAEDTLLLGTRDGRLMLLDGLDPLPDGERAPTPTPGHLRPLETDADALLREHRLYHGIRLSDGRLALATMSGGAVVLSADFEVDVRLDRHRGLPDLAVWYLHEDREAGLWLATNRGLARAELGSPLAPVPESAGILGSVEAVTRHDGVLYAATSAGLFAASGERFAAVDGPRPPCWALLAWPEEDRNRLLVGAYDGVWEVVSDGAHKLLDGLNAYVLHRSAADPTVLLVGDPAGLLAARFEGDRVTPLGRVGGLTDEVRSIAEDPAGTIWLGTHFAGVARVDLDLTEGVPVPRRVDRFGLDDGLPSLRSVKVVRGPDGLLFATPRGLVQLAAGDRFAPSRSLGPELAQGSVGVLRLVPAPDGSYWVSREGQAPAVARPQPDGSFRLESPGLDRLSDSRVLDLYPDLDGVTWIGTGDGLFRFDTRNPPPPRTPFETLLRRAAAGERALPLAGGSVPAGVVLAAADGPVAFELAAPSFDGLDMTAFRHRLEGLEASWSPWSASPRQEYASLPAGRYRFRVQARNAHGDLGREATFRFVVRPPWYLSLWAWAVYAAAAGLVLAGVVRARSATLLRRQARLEREVAERTADLARRTERLERIHGIIRSVNSEVGYDALLRAVLREVRIGAVEEAAFLVLEPATRRFRLRAVERRTDRSVLAGLELEAGELRSLVDRHAREILPGIVLLPAGVAGIGTSALIIPFSVDGRLEGCLALAGAPVYDADRVELLRDLHEHLLAAFLKARLLQDLQAVSDRKSEILRIAAHDFRSPLHVIISHLELLATRLHAGRFDPEDSALRLETLIRRGRQAVELLERLLDLSAVERGRASLNREPFHPGPLLQSCVEAHREAAARKGIDLELDLPAHLPVMVADRVRVGQVVDNLVSNAVKFTNPGGEVQVQCEAGERELLVRVRDSGQGLAEDDLPHLFLGLKRLSAVPTGGETSSGLGLAIAKSIVDRHGGRIWVESEEGAGATFAFTLPLSPGERAAHG